MALWYPLGRLRKYDGLGGRVHKYTDVLLEVDAEVWE